MGRSFFRRTTAAATAVFLLSLVGVLVMQSPAAATDETCVDFGYVEGFKTGDLSDPTYPWAPGYSVALAKAGSENQDLGHELVFKSETDPIVHSSGKDLSHVHFCESPDDPAIEIVKTGDEVAHEGDEITYFFEVTNTGDVDLTNVSVDDDVLGHIGDIALLEVDESETLDFETVALGDDVTNTAEACGVDASEVEVCDDDDHTLDVIHPDIEIVKSGAEEAEEGDEVEYSFEVTNTGDVDLTSVSVDDDVLGHIGDIALLEVDETETLNKTVPAPADDVRNVAEACGIDPLQEEVCGDDDHTLDVIHPAITIDKRVGGGDHKPVEDALVTHAGNELGYTILITNTGDTDLEITSLVDSLVEGVIENCSQGIGSTLEPGDSMTCNYLMTSESVDVHNEVSVTAVDSLGGEAGAVGASDETFVTVIDPEIQIVKTVNPETVEPGQLANYTFEVTNIGDTGLVDIAVTDNVLGDIGTIDALAPGESATLTEAMTVAADSPRTNLATACGVDELGLQACANDDATITIVLPLLPEGRDGATDLPATGFNLLLWIALGTALTAAGVTMTQTQISSKKSAN